MSDYLGNLAAKSLEAVATIRPRLSSFYEAPQRGFALPAEPAEIVEERSDAPAISAQTREKRVVATAKPAAVIANAPNTGGLANVVADFVVDEIQPRTATIAPAIVSNENSMAAAAPPTPRVAADRVAGPAFTSSSSPVANDAVSESPREPERRHASPAIMAAERAVERAPDSATDVEFREPPRIEARIATRITEQSAHPQPHAANEPPVLGRGPLVAPELPSPSRRSHEEITRNVSNDFVPPRESPRRENRGAETPELPSPSAVATPHRITPSRIVAEARPSLRVQPMPRSIRPDRQPPAAPDVHVTIGRVEVRAVPAAEPPSRARSAAPSALMNLDDYLRRRDGRGRR
jgi:hypothetical protein